MSYNYGSAAEVLENVFEVIEGGQSATATGEVIADNGAKIFDIATKEVYAANGSAAEVAEVVSVAEGTTAGTTAGAGILAVDVGVAGAAIAPCLGVVAGFGLYNLAPDFWDSVAEQLVNAGQTVKGKVQALLLPDGTTAFSKDTIEIFKNSFLNAGMFETQVDPIDPPDEAQFTASCVGYTINQFVQIYPQFADGIQQYIDAGNDLTGDIVVYYQRGSNVLQISFYSAVSGNLAIYNRDFIEGYGYLYNTATGVNWLSLVGSRRGNGGVAYYPSTGQCSLFVGGGLPSGQYARWLIFAGLTALGLSTSVLIASLGLNTVLPPNIQPNATLPTTNPFPQTYPNWSPIEYPQGLPSELPDYYPVSIPTPDITQDPAQSGENAADSQLDKLIELLFNSLPEPDPQIEPDPDAGIEPDPEPSTQPKPDPNPPDPNPPLPDPSGVIPLPTVETTRADRMFTVYNPTDTEVNSLGAFLWTNNVIEQIKKLWDDPMQAIITFHKIYGAPSVGSSKEIVLGYIESGVNAAVVTSQFCEVDCGSVTVPELNKNATSYSPFTSLHIYLPFVGIMELDTNECMNATLHVKYRIDVYTGTCIAMIYVSRTPDLPTEQMLYSFSGNASQQLPLTSSSFGGAISALLGLAGAGVAVASGGALGVAAGAVSAAHSLTQEMVHINRSGGLSANAGILAPRKPYLILSRQYSSDANGYAGFYGYPSNKTVYIGNCNGYIKCKDVIFRGSCTQAEVNEIESLLKSGVYV